MASVREKNPSTLEIIGGTNLNKHGSLEAWKPGGEDNDTMGQSDSLNIAP